jgi:tetratricopeptide (TPR) repeat protein
MGVKADLPGDLHGHELEERFAEMLAYAASERRVIILADALDQFERTDRMLTLSWLPDPLPPNVRLLTTAIPGPESKKLARRRGSRVTALPAFTAAEVEAVARVVYARYHRSPAAEVITRLGTLRRPDGQFAAGNALWLTLALELLNLLDGDDFAEAEGYIEGRPDEKLSQLVLNRCKALRPTIEDLYGDFLRQVEKAVGKVEARAFAALIALSRNGWREEDLQELLTPAAAVLFPGEPRVEWDALRFATFRRFFRAHLVARGEHKKMDFGHASLRAAIKEQLQANWKPSSINPLPALHSVIADSLETTLNDSPVRSDEMMYQMLRTGDVPRFAHYYAFDDSGSGRLAEDLIDESHASDHPLLDLVCVATADKSVPDTEKAAIGRKFNFDLFKALEEHDGGAVQAPLLEAAQAVFSLLRQRSPQSAQFAHDLCVSYQQMGRLHKGLGHEEKASAFFQKAADIVGELFRANPHVDGTFARDLAVTVMFLADQAMECGDERAIDGFQKVIAISEELRRCNQQSDVFIDDLSTGYSKMGDLHKKLEHFDQSVAFYQKALDLREELRQRNPQSDVFAHNLSISHDRMGSIHQELGHFDQALVFYQKARDIAEELRQRNPQSGVFARNLSAIYGSIGGLHRDLGQGEQALQFHQEALDIAEELRQRNPQSADFAHVLTSCYSMMGDLNRELERSEQALEFYQKAVDLREELRERDSQSPVVRKNSIRRFSTQCSIVTFRSPA